MRICPQCRLQTPERRCPTDGYSTVPAKLYDDVDHGLVGTVFEGRYRLTGLIGKGGMGAVYQAQQLNVGDRPVAVKVLRRHHADSLTEVARFQREVLAVSQLEHPNTIRVFDYGQTDAGDLYLVTELLVGRPLSTVLAQEGALSPNRAAHIAAQILKSLGEAHRARIVHRDIKPENIFLREVYGESDFVKVLDFGLARLHESIGDGGDQLTRTGYVMGTPAYMSPEQARAEAADHRSDIYSFGIVLFQMLTGHRPFPAKTLLEQLNRQINDPVPPMSEWVRVPASLEALVQHCLHKRPEQRPQSARHVQEALARFLDGREASVIVTPVTPHELVADTLNSRVLPPALPPVLPPLLPTPIARPVTPVLLSGKAPEPLDAPEAASSSPSLEAVGSGDASQPTPVQRSSPPVASPAADDGIDLSARPRSMWGGWAVVVLGAVLVGGITWASWSGGWFAETVRDEPEPNRVLASDEQAVPGIVPPAGEGPEAERAAAPEAAGDAPLVAPREPASARAPVRPLTLAIAARQGRRPPTAAPSRIAPADVAADVVSVRVEPTPGDAEVWLDGVSIGRGIRTVTLPRGAQRTLRVARAGYRAEERVVDGSTERFEVRLQRRRSVPRKPYIEPLPP